MFVWLYGTVIIIMIMIIHVLASYLTLAWYLGFYIVTKLGINSKGYTEAAFHLVTALHNNRINVVETQVLLCVESHLSSVVALFTGRRRRSRIVCFVDPLFKKVTRDS